MSDFHERLCEISANARFLENSLHPFHRLHPDIIVEISKYLDPRACNNGYAQLLHASQICRSWRETLVSQPTLWSFINGSRPGLIPCFLDRSGNAHLDIYIVSRRVKEVIEYINPHIDRLRSLHIELSRDRDSQFLALRDLEAAPMLRRLNIECRGILGPDNLEFTPGIVGPTPSLYHLQLFGIHITPQLLQLRNLTFVSLDVSTATLRVSLDLLSRNPFLRVIHLWGQDIEASSEDISHPPGSINLPHLEVLLSGMTPLAHLEALSPPRGARIFSGFARGGSPNYYPRGSHIASFPPPASFSNLRDLRKLTLVDQGEIYMKLEGEDGSVTYCMYRDRPFKQGSFSGLPLGEVTDATYEITPLFWHRPPAGPTTSQFIVSRIVCGMTRLQKLELSSCNAEQVEYFLLVLHSTSVCRDLKFLVLSHCVELGRQMRGLVTMAEGRKAEGIGLDNVQIVHSNIQFLMTTFKQGEARRLEHAVGNLKYLRAEQGRAGRSSLRFDPDIGVAQPHMFF